MIKTYEPEFTQLPFGFLAHPKNMGLRKVIRTKGEEYLAYYIVIQDAMGGHSEEEFTLSYEELIDTLCENLYLHGRTEEDIRLYIEVLLAANVLEKRWILNPITQLEEERYCLPIVADILESLREHWYSKVINPMKISKEDKANLKAYKEKINECRREIRKLNSSKDYLNALLKEEHLKDDVDGKKAEEYRLKMEDCDKKKKDLYRQIYVYEDLSEKISEKEEMIDE